jgi:ADP-heptose:LPS heptosyltransferase
MRHRTGPRILVIRRENIGDLVLTTPLIRALREKFPDGYIACLVNNYNAPVLVGNPDVDQVLAAEQNRHQEQGDRWQRFKRNLKLYFSAWRVRFDYVVLATIVYQPKDVRLARSFFPRQIVAFSNPRVKRGVDISVPSELIPAGHLVEELAVLGQAFNIVEATGPSRVYPDPTQRTQALQAIEAEIPGSGALVALHISSRSSTQRWSAAKFVALAAELHQATGCRFVLFWSPGAADNQRHPGDDEKANEILTGTAGLPICGFPTETLDQLIAGLACCDTVICSDGGAMHLAAALEKPIVCMFGNAEARRWYPWKVPHVVLQESSHIVEDISVGSVTAAYQNLLRQIPTQQTS